ncbi:MAG: hypothetical protein IJO69_03050 [Ruminiclostridium sp.]|nr:hypothetical protein [Ruminiclostridium sp.]MBQ9932795.1 hypothetical protein [Ruminiclostridium sp.]
MSHKKKVALILAILCMIFLAANSVIRTWTFQQSFYPMDGEVTVIDKFETEDGFFLTIKEDGASQAEFDLSCTQEQYNAVEVGDLVNCERYESILTHTGIIHNIEPVS